MAYGAAMEPVAMAPMSAFAALDTNHDGVITRQEFMQMQR
jgi:hypothetical protein